MSSAFRPGATVKLSVGLASSNGVSILGLGPNIRVANYGNSDACINLTQSFVSATSSDMVIMARTVEVFDRGWNTVVAGVGLDGDTVLDITSGDGG